MHVLLKTVLASVCMLVVNSLTTLSPNILWQDDFSSTEWSPASLIDSKYHGFWSSNSNLQRTFKVNVNNGINYANSYSVITLKFNAMVLCSWDGEYFQLKVGNDIKWQQLYHFNSNNLTIPTQWVNAGVCVTHSHYKYASYPITVTFNTQFTGLLILFFLNLMRRIHKLTLQQTPCNHSSLCTLL